MPVVSISLNSNLLRKLDEFSESRGYSSRSEVIRDAVRSFLSEYTISELREGMVTATITVMNSYGKSDVEERLMKLRHDYDETVTGNMHLHIDRDYCLEVFIVEGDIERVREFIGKIRAIRGVEHVKYTVLPLLERSQ